jgi:hypothetical protein
MAGGPDIIAAEGSSVVSATDDCSRLLLAVLVVNSVLEKCAALNDDVTDGG